ncbi:MAG: LmeA family phospholipid-binding protein, partial [Abditibacteriota bacterium]|nr:LmeA family phospholipid-binding protein [Abditibacteriota bacterium]
FSDWIRGRVERVELTGKNVRYDGTRYEELNIVLPNIVYSVSSKRITECDNGFFKASLTEKEINRIAAENAKKGESLEIELREGSLEAVAVKKVLGVSVKARAEGTLSIKNGSSVWFDPKKIDIPGIKVSLKGWTKDAVSGSINPVYTLDTSKNGLYLSKVACKKGRLRVEGNIKSEVLLRNQ